MEDAAEAALAAAITSATEGCAAIERELASGANADEVVAGEVASTRGNGPRGLSSFSTSEPSEDTARWWSFMAS